MARGIDHFVIAVRDLGRARSAYERLGFTVTPEARHPFGTKNALVQLDGAFLELVAIGDPAAIPEPTPTFFSFAAFNRDFLAYREGPSMLALKSRDPAADRAAFAARHMLVYDLVHFERSARGPDGKERTVAFTMTFTGEKRIREAAFFTCRHHFPENFWRPEYQRHANGARQLASVVMTARDPADFHEFLTYFTGEHDMRSTSLGVEFDTGDGRIEVFTPVGVRGFFGDAAAVEADPKPHFLACRIAVADRAATRALLERQGVPFEERLGELVIPASEACGCAIAFSAEADLSRIA